MYRSVVPRSLAASLLLCACVPNLNAPDQAKIACEANNDCPQGWICNGDLGLCAKAGASANRPSVVVGAISRTLSDVEIPVVVYDRDGDDVTLRASLSFAGLTQDIEVQNATVTASADGVETTLVWKAAEFFGSSALERDLVIRLQPSDGDGFGPTIASAAFDFGNDAPELLSLDVTEVGPSAGGLVAVTLRVNDSSNDLVSLAQFRVVPTGGGAAIDIPLADFPDADSLTFSADGGDQTIVWDSTGSAAITSTEVRLTAVVEDALGGQSELVLSPPFVLDNAPSLELGPVVPADGVRELVRVGIPFVVRDPSGAAAELSLALEYGVDGVWYPAALHASSSATTGLSGDESAGVWTWDALADAALATKGLSTNDQGGVAYAPVVHIRGTVSDDDGLSRTVELSTAIGVGNDAPVLTLSPPDAIAQGLIPLSYFIQDSAADTARVEAQFRLPNDPVDGWHACALGGGTDRDLPTDEASPGRPGVFVWNSRAGLDVDANAGQGVGSDSYDGVELRLRACDIPDGVTSSCGPFAAATIGSLRNQTPAIVSQLRVVRSQGYGANGPFILAYRIDDAEGDLVDVHIEASFDYGDTWNPLREYPLPQSEGLYDLAPGFTHTFVGDPSGILLAPNSAVRVRVIATDGYPVDAPAATSAETVLAQPLGPLGPPVSSAADAAYASAATYAASTSYYHIGESAVGDFNNDGIPDVVLLGIDTGGSDIPNGVISCMRGNGSAGVGNGAFTSSFVSSVGAIPSTAAVGDFDKDGKLDLAVVHTQGPPYYSPLAAGIALMFGDGAGAFTVAVRITTYGQPGQLLTADFNGDGYLDLLLSGDEVRIIFGSAASPSRSAIFDTTATVTLGSVANATIADFDGDGVLDIATLGGGSVWVARGQGNGTFLDAEAYGPVPDGQLTSGRLDGDARDDLAATSGGELTLLLTGERSGTALFGEPHSNPAEGASYLRVADMNADGLGDLITSYDPEVGIFITLDEQGRVAPAQRVTMTTGLGAVQIVDSKEDGAPDVLAASYDIGGLVVALAQRIGQSTVGTLVSTGTIAVGSDPRSVEVADMNLDGAPDLLVPSGGNGAPYVVSFLEAAALNGLGQGTYQVRATFAGSATYPMNAATDTATADYNGDGFLDVATAEVDDVAVVTSALPAGTRVPTFSEPDSYDVMPDASDAMSVVAGDFNEDGHVDLAVAVMDRSLGGPPGNVVILLNNGTGEAPYFTRQAPVGVPKAPMKIIAADLNADGIQDLVTACMSDSKVAVLFGQGSSGVGDGTFAAPLSLSSVSAPRGVAACDVNADGVLDLVAQSYSASSLSYFAGQGTNGVPNGNFAAGVTVSTSAPGYDITCADANGDGAADIIVPGNDSQLSFFYGAPSLSPPLRTPAVKSSIGAAAERVAASDLNGDDMLELLTADVGPDAVTVTSVQLNDMRLRWTRTLTTLANAQPWVRAHNAVPLAGLDRFGDPLVAYVSQHRAPERLASPPPLTMTCGVAGAKYVPLSDTWHVEGDVRLTRVSAGGAPRLQVVARLGEPTTEIDRGGLHLDDASEEDQRGLIVELPRLSGANALIGADATKVFVVQRLVDWQRASELSEDALFEDAEGTRYLPSLPTGEGTFRDVVRPKVTWRQICPDADDDLATGTGARFVLRDDKVQVLTDAAGDLQAFVRAP